MSRLLAEDVTWPRPTEPDSSDSEAINMVPLVRSINDLSELPGPGILAYFEETETQSTGDETQSMNGGVTHSKPWEGQGLVLRTWEQTLPSESFKPLQRWEGVVLQVKQDTFFVRLVDLTQLHADEEAELDLRDISPDDMPMVEPGAIFYWNIGYRDTRQGRRERVSQIRFRRLPAWTRKEIATATQRAERIGDLLGWK